MRSQVAVVPLDGSNYVTWKVQCRMALIKENLWGIVSGTEVSPPETEADKFAKFVVRRNRALATIVLSVNTSLLYLLGDPEDPVVVWNKLSEQFQKKTWANKLSLRRKLNNLRLKEEDSVKSHVKAITEIFNELAVIGAPMEDEDKVVTLLASLPDKFDMLVTALEANTEVPSMEIVTERLLHEENKLKERGTVETSTEKVMLGKKTKDRPKCHHCGKPGHLKRNCWSLKKENEKEQQSKQESKSVKHKANVVAADSESESLGLVTQALAASACSNNVWIIDSGATCHMTHDRTLMRNIVELSKPVEVQLGDGKVLNATARGTVILYTVLSDEKEKRCYLQDVLFVPKLSYSLLSVPKATGAGLKVSFDDSECMIVRPDGETIAVGKKIGDLFHLKYRREVELSNAMTTKSDTSKEMLWHKRYGHLGVQNLKKLANESLVTGFDFDPKKNIDFCEACVQGKLHRCAFPTSGAKRATEPLGLVHSDLCGKITPKSAGSAKYFMTLTDDKTRYVWVYTLKKKDEAFQKFKEWKALVEKSSDYTLKVLRSDNGGEYVSTDFDNFLKSEGVVHQTTVPYTPQQNGVAERLNRTLVESVRSMLVHAKLPRKFWVEALNTSVYLHNRSPTRALDGQTPYEAWTGLKPDVSNLKCFGCTAYAHIPKDERKKLDPKARKCVFLGYGTEIKGYRLFDVERQRVIYSRDVTFNENEFGILQNDEPDETVNKFVDVELSIDDDVSDDVADTYVNEGQSDMRQSSRERRPPNRLGEWVTLASDALVEPTTVSEALNGPDADQWHKAMQQEMDSLHKHDVWNLTELPEGRKAIGSKWVFRVKYNADGSMERLKARLVAQGYSQRYGVDYDETFSPVVRFESLRTVAAMSVKQGLKLHQMDVTTAFLNGDLEEEVYIKQPEGFAVKGKEHLVCKLNKSLYGLKQSPRCWNYTLDEHLKTMGLVQTPSDPCIYVSEKDADPLIVAVYVDDIVLAGPSDEKITEVKQNISERFEVKDMGELKYFLGIQVIQEDGKVWIGQPTYTENILKKFGMEDCKPVSTPVDANSKLTNADADNVPHNQSDYQSAVGSLLYLSSATRPDIAFAVSNVARYCSNPTSEHWTAVKRILRYLKGTVNYGVFFTNEMESECVGFSDADWAGDVNDRKSTSGYLFQMCGGAISWRSKKQPCVALSTAEAEYIALSSAVQEALWIKQLLLDMKEDTKTPITMYEDNQAAINMTKNPNYHGRAKHVDIKYHFIRDQVDKNTVNITYCPTNDMIADILTKGLHKGQFVKLRKLAGVVQKP